MSETYSDPGKLLDELFLTKQRAGELEITACRAREGARAASKGAERLRRKVEALRVELKLANGRIERLQHECSEQKKKVTQLSLDLLAAIEQRQQ